MFLVYLPCEGLSPLSFICLGAGALTISFNFSVASVGNKESPVKGAAVRVLSMSTSITHLRARCLIDVLTPLASVRAFWRFASTDASKIPAKQARLCSCAIISSGEQSDSVRFVSTFLISDEHTRFVKQTFLLPGPFFSG